MEDQAATGKGHNNMRDLNLGPESRKLVERYRKTSDQKLGSYFAAEMSKLLERWTDIAWCWIDAAPARICGGPHVRVKYQLDSTGHGVRPMEYIEQVDHVGETFPGIPYTVIKEDGA